MQPAEWQKALEATDANFNHLIDGRVRDFNMAQGYIDGHPAAMSQFQKVETPGGSVSLSIRTAGSTGRSSISTETSSTGYWILGHWSI